MRAYKFYSKRWGLEALYRQRLKITTVQELNDPFEFMAVNTRVKNDRSAQEDWKNREFRGKGLLCFSKNWHNPVIWSHYAESHKGLALGFDIENDNLFVMNYVKKRIAMLRKITDIANKKDRIKLAYRLMTTKFHHWSYEDEVRIFTRLTKDIFENGFYFEPFGKEMMLKEVVFGAYYETGNNKRLFEELGKMGVEFSSTRLAFKSFAVVPQKNRKFWKSL